MYGGFWMSFATIFIPGSGVAASYTDATEFNSAVGIYLWTWFIVTFLLLYVPFPFLFQCRADDPRAASRPCGGTWA